MKKKSLSILHIMYSGLGGASSVAFSLINSKIKDNSKHQVLFLGEKLLNYYKNYCKKKKLKFTFIKKKKLKDYVKTTFLVFEKIKLIKPEIVFIHDFNIIPCLFYKFFFKKTKLIFVNHTTLKSPNSWKISLAIKFLFFFDAFVVLNEEDYNLIIKKNNSYLKKIFLIKNGVNINYFSNKIKNNKDKIFKIGMACRIDGSRPYRLIAQSLADPLINNLKIIFSICGEGDDLVKFRKFLYRNNLQNKVIFEKFLYGNNLKKWYNSLDLYVQASFGEGMSMSVLQAMSMKIPVIGSKVTGLKSLLNNKKKVGMLFNNNAKNLAECINLFYTMSFLEKKKYTDSQYKNILKNYSNLQMNQKYLSLIRKILNV